MKILLQSLLLAGLCLGRASAADAPGFDVLQSMSVADFRASGLDKLSDAQIKALDAWFAAYQRQHALTCNGAAPPVTAPAQTSAAVDTYPMTAHIVGEFHGWNGSTRVTLDNGQVWEQMDDTTVTAGRMTNPEVTISRGLLNSFYISVKGVSDSVEVKRIKD